jgi:vancomycin aglycone glucosyltransferase
MRVLLSTIGSRGDVQPLVALAVQLRGLGQEARVCAPPDFRDWVQGFGIPFVPLGPEVAWTAKPNSPLARGQFTAEQKRQMMEGTVATQFGTIPAAAKGCDVIVAGNALNIAARSVAEQMGIRYVFAAYCPITLPSAHHAPPKVLAWTPKDATADNLTLWAEDAERWTENWGPALNSHRASLGLPPVTDVRGHILTDTPWLAADPTLAPWPEPADPGEAAPQTAEARFAGSSVFQAGAWILPDERPLPPELETFLEAGKPPIYFGFGSIRAPQDLSKTMIETARALGRRAIVSRGWADLSLLDDEPDCLSIGDVNLQALFRRVAAVVHHGGAGTTTLAAGAGAPQVVIPQQYDQPYFAQRINDLGLGCGHPSGIPTTESLTSALDQALQPGVAVRARSVASAVRRDGALAAARRLVSGVPRTRPDTGS